MDHDDNAENDIKKLNGFLDDASNFLYGFIKDGKVIKDFNSIEEIWGIVNQSLEESRSFLNAAHGKFEITKHKLKNVGLTSTQLNFKLKGFNELCTLWKEKSAQWEWGSEKFKAIGKFIFKWINNILSSLCIAIPGLEIVREFKEHVELKIEFDDLKNSFEELESLKL